MSQLLNEFMLRNALCVIAILIKVFLASYH